MLNELVNELGVWPAFVLIFCAVNIVFWGLVFSFIRGPRKKTEAELEAEKRLWENIQDQVERDINRNKIFYPPWSALDNDEDDDDDDE